MNIYLQIAFFLILAYGVFRLVRSWLILRQIKSHLNVLKDDLKKLCNTGPTESTPQKVDGNIEQMRRDIRDLKNAMTSLGHYFGIKFEVHNIPDPNFHIPKIEIVKIVKESKIKTSKKKR